MSRLQRESPPDCLLDPGLGKHLSVKINVMMIFLLLLTVMCSGLQVSLCGEWVSGQGDGSVSA